MANHVDNVLSITTEIPEAKILFNEVFSSIQLLDESGLQYSNFLPQWDGDWPSRDYMEEIVGAKWAIIESVSDRCVVITSAWSSIYAYVKNMGHYLSEIDPNVIISCRYEDEFYNFAGAMVYFDGGLDWQEESLDWFIADRCEDLGMIKTDWDSSEDYGWYKSVDNKLIEWETDLIEKSRINI